MTPAQRYDRAIWFAVLLAVVVLLFLTHGCTEPPAMTAEQAKSRGQACADKVSAAIKESGGDCEQTKATADSVVAIDPDCVAVMRGKQLKIPCLDGGTHD